jgi:hypothetical protein
MAKIYPFFQGKHRCRILSAARGRAASWQKGQAVHLEGLTGFHLSLSAW